MKILSIRKARTTASVLVITLTIVVITAMVMGSYLTLVQYQTNSVARSQTWNSIIPVTEAGIEDAMARINGSGATVDPTGMAWVNNGTEGWSAFSNGVSTVTRYVTGDSYYVASIDITGVTATVGPKISSVGYVPYTQVPWVFSLNSHTSEIPGNPPFFLAAAGVDITAPVSSTVARKVQIQTTLMPLFAIGIACRSNFAMNGKNCRVDSFNSTDTNYSIPATATLSNSPIRIYSPGTAKSGGDVGVNSSVTGSTTAGNGSIYGHLHTGPGSLATQVVMGPQGTVGDLVWGAANDGIQGLGTPDSWWLPDFNVSFPDVQTPTYSGSGLPAPDGSSGYTVLNGGNYTTASSSGAGKLLITAPTVLWLQNGGSFGVTMANTNASLTLYVGQATGSGTSLSLSGNGTMNAPGLARNLQIYGLPSCTALAFAGNAAWNACVYAPNATMTGGGGGTTPQDTQGSIVVKGITLNGHWNFHYDESLKMFGATRGWVAKNWTEMPLH